LTREQIRLLMKDRKPDKLTHPPQPAGSEPPNRGPHSAASVPLLPPEITSYFVPALHGDASTYKPVLLGAATLHYLDIKTKIDEVRRVLFTTTFEDGPGVIDWDRSRPLIVSLDELEREPDAAITFVDLPKAAANPKNYPIWTKRFAAWIFRAQQLNLLKSPSLGVISTPGETEGAFRVRLQQMAREERDRLAESLKQKYASKFAALEEKKRRAELNAQRQKSQQNQAILDTALSAGSSLLGAFLGRKAISVTNASRAATVARQAGKSWRESQDVAQATETVEQVVRQQTDLQAQFEADLAAQQARVDPATEQFEPVTVRLKKSNITVDLVALGWNPNV
jgi:hypothetical protein